MSKPILSVTLLLIKFSPLQNPPIVKEHRITALNVIGCTFEISAPDGSFDQKLNN